MPHDLGREHSIMVAETGSIGSKIIFISLVMCGWVVGEAHGWLLSTQKSMRDIISATQAILGKREGF